MRKDPENQAVTHMDQHEIDLFVMYRNQLARPGGRTRDDLPYTPEFDNLMDQYNQQAAESLDHRSFWGLLRRVLKHNEVAIELYLQQSRDTSVPPKPRSS